MYWNIFFFRWRDVSVFGGFFSWHNNPSAPLTPFEKLFRYPKLNPQSRLQKGLEQTGLWKMTFLCWFPCELPCSIASFSRTYLRRRVSWPMAMKLMAFGRARTGVIGGENGTIQKPTKKKRTLNLPAKIEGWPFVPKKENANFNDFWKFFTKLISFLLKGGVLPIFFWVVGGEVALYSKEGSWTYFE